MNESSSSNKSHRIGRLSIAAAMVVSCIVGLGIVLANLAEFTVSVLAIPLLAGLTVMSVNSARKLTQSAYQDQYVLRKSRTFYLFLAAAVLAGAVYAVAASELSMIGIYLVLLSQGILCGVQKDPDIGLCGCQALRVVSALATS